MSRKPRGRRSRGREKKGAVFCFFFNIIINIL
jgi:hypothetical protein